MTGYEIVLFVLFSSFFATRLEAIATRLEAIASRFSALLMLWSFTENNEVTFFGRVVQIDQKLGVHT